MSGSMYHKIGRLATHPAFSMRLVALACPLCRDFETMRCGEYNKHFLAHEPTQEQAYRWLDWKAYGRLAAKQGWPDTDQLVAEGKP